MESHLDGLREYGVALSGSAKNLVIENRSGRTVIAYVLNSAARNGRRVVHQMLLTFSAQPAGIPDGGSIYVHGNMPVNLIVPMQSPAQTGTIRQRPIVRAMLRSIVFADGQFVGVDEHGAFESFGKRIKVITEVGLLGKAGAWDQVEVLAQALTQLLSVRPPGWEDSALYFDRRAAATLLDQERREKGEAAAAQLAELYSSLPTLWR